MAGRGTAGSGTRCVGGGGYFLYNACMHRVIVSGAAQQPPRRSVAGRGRHWHKARGPRFMVMQCSASVDSQSAVSFREAILCVCAGADPPSLVKDMIPPSLLPKLQRMVGLMLTAEYAPAQEGYLSSRSRAIQQVKGASKEGRGVCVQRDVAHALAVS
jgi:hypothetical protein